MEQQGFDNFHVPVTTTSISSPMGLGSDSEPVDAIINGHKVYLADSLQFLLELGLRVGQGPQYYISSSFRGEDVDSTHLSEFSHAEVEIRGNLDDIIELGGRYVSELAASVLADAEADIQATVGRVDHLAKVAAMKGAFQRLTFNEACAIVREVPEALKMVCPGVQGLTRIGERHIMKVIGEPVWITHMPALSCPFYQRAVPGSDACASADLLLGPGEILGSGARCVDEAELLTSLAAHQVSPESYTWYVQMKRLAPLETAGFGLGLERFLMWALNADDIRDCTPWIRRRGEVVDP